MGEGCSTQATSSSVGLSQNIENLNQNGLIAIDSKTSKAHEPNNFTVSRYEGIIVILASVALILSSLHNLRTRSLRSVFLYSFRRFAMFVYGFSKSVFGNGFCFKLESDLLKPFQFDFCCCCWFAQWWIKLCIERLYLGNLRLVV